MASGRVEMPPGRRDILKFGVASLGASVALSAVWAEVASAAPAPDADMALLDAVSDLVIPATAIPGARAAGVPAFLAVAIAHHTLGARGDEVARLRTELDHHAGGDFLALPPARREAVLTTFDAQAYAPGADANGAWRMVKTLILAGYYSSEIGGSKDQRYELVPGRFDADIAYHPGDPALSNDWAGVAFR